MLTVVADGCPGQPGGKDHSSSLIDEIVREGARRMLAQALQAEVDDYIARHAAERMRTAAAWWSATATTRAGRCRPARARCR